MAVGAAVGKAGGALADLVRSSEPVNKLAFASGAGTADLVKETLPDVLKIAKAEGEPKTVGEYQDAIQRAKSNLNDEYAESLGKYKDVTLKGSPIAAKIRALVTPNMGKTASGRLEAKAIERAAKEFDGGWTLDELDHERMDANARLNAYESKSMVDQYATLKKSRSVAIDKAIADGVRESVYPFMDQVTGKAAGYFANLKGQIGSLLELQSKVEKQAETLRDTTARIKGAPALERIHIGTSISGRGTPHGYIAGIKEAILPRNPEKSANAAVKSAFRAPAPRRTATSVKGLPFTLLLATPKPPAPRAGNPTDAWAQTHP
jgi:hypothetical protein